MPGFERADIEVNGVRTAVLTAGSGPDLVFLHGTGTFPGFAVPLGWAAAGRRVIIPYHPNFGDSADSAEIAGMEDYVVHYMDLFDQLGLEKLDLAGFSLGGWIAAEFAVRQPQRLRRLVLVAPAGLVVPEAPPPDLFALAPQEIPAYLTHDPHVALGYLPQGPDPAFDARLGRELKGAGRILEGHPRGNQSLARWLHRLTMPTLLIWGEHDRLMPTAQARRWREYLPNCQFESIAATGHLVFEETPAAGELVISFLAGEPPATSGSTVT